MPSIFRLVLLALFFGFFVIGANLFDNIEVFAQDDNLVSDPDFEDVDNQGHFRNWTKNVSTLTVIATTSAEQVYSGTQSALLKSTSTSTKYLYQIVPATGSATFSFSGWAKQLFGSASAYLRVTECSTTNCNSSKEEITSHDSAHSVETSWLNLAATFTTATNTASLKLKINLDPNNASPSALVWDNLRLQKVLPLTINYSLPASVSADQQFFVPLTITNAVPETKYFLKGVSGTSISTFNNSWLAWNGSWTDMPSLTTDSFGSGSATLSVRFNSSTVTLGQNTYLVRLRKDGTSDNIDAATAPISVNAPETISSSTTITSNNPDFDFSLPAAASVEGQFDVSVKIINLQADTKYYFKVRIGPDSSHLTSGQTYNNEWLSDNASWAKFPGLVSDSNGKWEGKITTRLSDDETPGSYKVGLRIRKVGDDTNFDSDSKEMTFTQKSAVGVSVASSSAAISSTVLPDVLGIATKSGFATASAILESASSGKIDGKVQKKDDFGVEGKGLISWGMTIFGASLSSILFRKHQFGV